MEVEFDARYRSDFDKFVRDYLTLRLEPSKPVRTGDIYLTFRDYFTSAVVSLKRLKSLKTCDATRGITSPTRRRIIQILLSGGLSADYVLLSTLQDR